MDREILRLAIPAFGALVAEPLYILADTAVVGHLGTSELGGLAVAGTILVTGYTLFIFLAYGTTASVARLLGAGGERRAVHEGIQGLWLALIISLVLAFAGYLFSNWLVEAMGAIGDIRQHALTYLHISLLGLPALLVALAGTGYLRGLQDTRTPLVVTIASNLVNLVVELVLINGMGYGIGASALATVIAQYLALAVYLRIVAREARRLEVSLRPSASSLRSLARVGVDLFVRTVALRAALLVATGVAARLGAVELGAHQIAFELWNFLALVLDAVAIAGQAITGRYLGAGDAPKAREAGRRMIEMGLVGGVVLGVVIAALHALLPRIFTPDARVIALTSFLLWIVAALQPINSIAFSLDGILVGAGDARFLAWAMGIAFAAFLPAALGVLWLDAGIGALWAALGLFMTIRAVILLLRFRSTAWQIVGDAKSPTGGSGARKSDSRKPHN